MFIFIKQFSIRSHSFLSGFLVEIWIISIFGFLYNNPNFLRAIKYKLNADNADNKEIQRKGLEIEIDDSILKKET